MEDTHRRISIATSKTMRRKVKVDETSGSCYINFFS